MSKRDNDSAQCGWQSTIPQFTQAYSADIVDKLRWFVRDVSPEQEKAWQEYVPSLQKECEEFTNRDDAAATYSAILEYQLPYDLRRPDLIILGGTAVVVVELKGYRGLSQAGIDQVIAYVRDLKAYHRACVDRAVVPVLVTSGARHPPSRHCGATVCHPNDLDQVLLDIATTNPGAPVSAKEFVADDAYVPLPTIVQAARQLFETRELPYIKRARSDTEPALAAIAAIAHEAARTSSRHLVVLSGVPGSGKTLVGLQLAHARWLDDLSIPRAGGKPTVTGVYLSGNGPLIRVLQHALQDGGGGGKTFVRPIKDYVEYYDKRPSAMPPEHLLIYDEAQRAHDAEQVAHVHKKAIGMSEPAHLLEFCRRVPGWSVLVALIGTGQAIHAGEEVGLPLWKQGIEQLPDAAAWTVHCAPESAEEFNSNRYRLDIIPTLNLNKTLRFHLTADVDQFVSGVLENDPTSAVRELSDSIFNAGHRFFVTRDLEVAKAYVRERYSESPLARYGLLASSKDKVLTDLGVDNTFQTTKRLREGPWYNSAPDDLESCCQLQTVATEFASQGLELDFAVLAWGSDFRRSHGTWSDVGSSGYRRPVKNRLILRRNVYRVLLTRGRDGTVIFVPPSAEFDETAEWLLSAGVRELNLIAAQ